MLKMQNNEGYQFVAVKFTKILSVSCLIYFLLSIPVFILKPSHSKHLVDFNIILALVPLLLAILLQKSINKKLHWSIITILSMLWLLFFPNAPYMITMLIHTNNKLGVYTYSYDAYNISDWAMLAYIVLGVFLSSLTGFLSLHIIRQLVLKAKGRIISHATVIAVSLLSGYAIYIGKFLRFNSWDIVNPKVFMSILAKITNSFSIEFSLIIAVYILCIYYLLYILFEIKFFKDNSEK